MNSKPRGTWILRAADQMVLSGVHPLGAEVNGAANESEGHAASIIVIEGVPLKPFLLIALAALAGKTGPFQVNGVVKAVTVVSAKHVAPYFVATLHSHVTNWSSPSHDCLLKFWGPYSFVPLIAAGHANWNQVKQGIFILYGCIFIARNIRASRVPYLSDYLYHFESIKFPLNYRPPEHAATVV
jgi:hypothetical protein